MMASGILRERSSRGTQVYSNSPLGSGPMPLPKEKGSQVFQSPTEEGEEMGIGGRGCVWGTEAKEYR